MTGARYIHVLDTGAVSQLTKMAQPMFLSIDLGGSHMAVAVVEETSLLAHASMATVAGSLTGELDLLSAEVRQCITRSGVSPASLRGIAMGFCGIVDGRTGEILSTLDKYTDAPDVDLHAWAKREFGLPLRIQNDASMALLGEHAAGAARGASDVVMVTLGTGIGGAAMIEGRLLTSRAGQAGCLGGHLPVNYKGRLCSCGAVGCAEAEASTAVLPQLCREHTAFADSMLAKESLLNFETLFCAVDASDAVAQDVLKHCTDVWSALTVGLIHAYGPELVIFGGGVTRRGDSLLDPIRAYVGEHAWRTTRGLPRIEMAELGEYAALLGGPSLFLNEPRAFAEQMDEIRNV